MKDRGVKRSHVTREAGADRDKSLNMPPGKGAYSSQQMAVSQSWKGLRIAWSEVPENTA